MLGSFFRNNSSPPPLSNIIILSHHCSIDKVLFLVARLPFPPFDRTTDLYTPGDWPFGGLSLYMYHLPMLYFMLSFRMLQPPLLALASRSGCSLWLLTLASHPGFLLWLLTLASSSGFSLWLLTLASCSLDACSIDLLALIQALA